MWLAYYDEKTRKIRVKPFSVPAAKNYKHIGISTNKAKAIAIVKMNLLRCEANALRKLAAILETDGGGDEV